MSSVSGIDLSENNGAISATKLHQAGKRFVFLKVNEGTRLDRRTTVARVVELKRRGILVGGYDFLTPRSGRTGAQEFDIFYARAKEVGLVSKGCLRPVADVERTLFTGPLKAYKTRRYVQSWVKRCVERTGKRPIIYTGSWFWDGVMRAKNAWGCKLWLAAYVAERDMKKFIPQGFDHISFWQYTDKGHTPGVSGGVDLDRYLSSYANLRHNHTL